MHRLHQIGDGLLFDIDASDDFGHEALLLRESFFQRRDVLRHAGEQNRFTRFPSRRSAAKIRGHQLLLHEQENRCDQNKKYRNRAIVKWLL